MISFVYSPSEPSLTTRQQSPRPRVASRCAPTQPARSPLVTVWLTAVGAMDGRLTAGTFDVHRRALAVAGTPPALLVATTRAIQVGISVERRQVALTRMDNPYGRARAN